MCSRGNVSFLWNTWSLCAVAWLDVAEAYPCTEYSGSGTETVRQSTPTPDNCKLSHIQFTVCGNYEMDVKKPGQKPWVIVYSANGRHVLKTSDNISYSYKASGIISEADFMSPPFNI